MLELAKGMKHYPDLHGKEKRQVLATMLSHRLGELTHRFYGTHRNAARLSVSIEMDESAENIVDTNQSSPEEVVCGNEESKKRVRKTRSKLSPVAKQVFDACVYDNPKLTAIMQLSSMRSNAVFQQPTMTTRCWHVAEATMLPLEVVKEAFAEIATAYDEVCNGNH
jgi:hypothetical protein